MTMFDAQKHFGKHASHTLLLNALGPSPLGVEAMPLPIVVSATMQVMRVVLGMHPLLPLVRLMVC
jgi:hypothetical protein